MQIQRDDGRTILSMREWRAMVIGSERGIVANYLDGLQELAYTWCMGGSAGVPDEVAALLRSKMPTATVVRVVASPRLVEAATASGCEADLLVEIRDRDATLVALVVPISAVARGQIIAHTSGMDPLCLSLFGRPVTGGGRVDPTLGELSSLLVSAASAAIAQAAATGAAGAMVIIHEIVTPVTNRDELTIGRAHVEAFARALGLDSASAGSLAGPAALPLGPLDDDSRPRMPFWLGLATRQLPALAWID